ncbi:uncharacterized protein TNIN_58521 [Trichonephila inaurata madagascariensis]|uniref:Uncharacterized protein n=1 Tax=Trichonephila inaurata madagascariensis TaxID=2747483 RepID=A0A8X7C4T2_9ARAC|nr:uncharacterized protein TNIN_58521 [Trichonephila inaurata madagascariensis]
MVAVRIDKETTKVRMVFDASSKVCRNFSFGVILLLLSIGLREKLRIVSNRVIEIQSNSDPSDWHHCSGRENPADYVSRGVNLKTIINSQFWMHGPQWLRTTENNRPKNLNCDFSSTDPCESEEQVFTLAHVN